MFTEHPQLFIEQAAPQAPSLPQALRVDGNDFLLGGEPFRLIGGALHYARIPRPYWRDRLNKLIDLGANTVETYSFWNAHEPYQGRFDFSGMLDAEAFVELAANLGLHVIFRPGPYVCAEWDMGGLPWWLLNYTQAIRCSDPAYLFAVERYWTELMRRLAPLQSTRGGPIFAMQIENEYGYFGNDTAYLSYLHDLLRRLDIDVLLFTSDGTFQDLTIETGGLPGVLRTANFGSRAAERFAALRKAQPTGPAVCMEYWVGWFDEWRTGKHATRPATETAEELDNLLGLRDSHAVIYMFHGGTNWGFSAGGNLSDDFRPFVTSYDYDALLTEAGDITPKYEACRTVIHKHAGSDRAARKFAPSRKAAYGRVHLGGSVTLDDALPAIGDAVSSPVPLPMEKLGHGRGFVLYRTELAAIFRNQPLVLRGMHDWCHIRLNGRTLATWYRRDEQPPLPLDFEGDSATLEILVHNLGRSNFGHRMMEPKGLTGGAFVGLNRHDERALFGWSCQALPLNAPPAVDFGAVEAHSGPAFYHGTLTIDDAPADTFLELPGFDLGCVFVNGFNIGRYWNVGPQTRLFVPAPMLKKGANELVIFEAHRCTDTTIAFFDEPRLAP